MTMWNLSIKLEIAHLIHLEEVEWIGLTADCSNKHWYICFHWITLTFHHFQTLWCVAFSTEKRKLQAALQFSLHVKLKTFYNGTFWQQDLCTHEHLLLLLLLHAGKSCIKFRNNIKFIHFGNNIWPKKILTFPNCSNPQLSNVKRFK